MTNFQFYLNSPLQGQFILGPADGFFPKPFFSFLFVIYWAAGPADLVFPGAVGRGAARCIGAPRPCRPAPALEVSPSLRGLFFLC